MLTRFVRIQLLIFAIVGTIGVIAMVLFYIQVPTLLGIGRMTVTLELPATGGLYRFSNVTYRGVQMGKVTAVGLTPTGAKATLSLNTSPKVPADLTAKVLSVSAVGEQYVDLQPKTDSPPYLHDGSVIAAHDTTIPQAVGPMLDQLNTFVGSIPKTKLGQLLDETFQGFNGTGYDLGSLIDSSETISRDANGVVDRTRALTEDTGPLLDTQARTTDSIRTWARSFAGISDVLVNDDSHFRTILQNGPGAANEASRLLDQIKPTLPVLLANLTTIGQIGVTYHPSIEQLLVLLPSAVAIEQAAAGENHPDGKAIGDFALTIDDPPICTVGFMPPSSWRSPDDLSDIDTPDGLYCKLPQDSPLSVRGARNYPCMGHPGKRAPTVEICNSDKPYMPLAMKQHTSAPLHWIRICSPRASRPMTGLPPTTESSARSGGRRCHRERCRAAHPRGRGEKIHHRTRLGRRFRRCRRRGRPRWHPCRPCRLTFRRSRHSTCLHRGNFPRHPPRPRRRRHLLLPHHRIRSVADSPRRRQARSAPTHLSPRPRSWWQSTIRTPGAMSARTGSCTSSRISRPRKRPRRGRTCFPAEAACRATHAAIAGAK